MPMCIRSASSMLPSTSGSGGNSSSPRGPIYTHRIPPRTRVGYAVALTLDLKSDSAGSFGISTDVPDPVKQKQLYSQLNDIYLDQSWVLPIIPNPERAVARSNVHGLRYDSRPG